MNKREGQCSAFVVRQVGRTPYDWDRVPCRRPAKFIADGKEFCWQHKPSAAEAVVRQLQDAPAIGKAKFLDSKAVGLRYGHGPAWARHCKDLRSIARKVGKFLMWREDELEALETARWREDRDKAKAAEKARLEEKYSLRLVDGTND